MRKYISGGIRRQLALVTALLTLAPSLPAHNKVVHQDLTDLAYMVMLAVKQGTVNPPPPPGVSAGEWGSFLNAMKQTPDRYRARPTALPNAITGACAFQPGNVGSTWASQPTAGTIPFAVSTDYIVGFDCGVRYNYQPGGFYNTVNMGGSLGAVAGKRDYTGTVLGFWAAAVDDEFDDTHLWHKPTLAGGQGNMWDTVNDIGNAAIAPVLFPFVCIWSLFQGNFDCLGATADAADEANKMDDLNGLIPGVGDISGEDYVGVWHHIKVLGTASNEFDNDQGLLMDEAGAWNEVDPFDLLAMAGADLGGIALDYDESNGPKRYEITGAADGHPNSVDRSMGEWQFLTTAHLPHSPVDNLAYYGWKKFRDESAHSLKYLGWPLHALQDASVPMHVAGSSAWGHRPYEEAFDKTWARLRYLGDDSTAADVNAQRAQATAILNSAFHYYKFIQDWRVSHPGQSKDVPIRDLVTKVAKATGDYSMSRQDTYNWPFSTWASTQYMADSQAGINHYTSIPNHVSLNQPLINGGAGATLAFLVASSDIF
jgi:hypothetical protein